ncbi:FAD-binding oxidoreductase [Spirilliplanes yamanashiensis]|uniref:Glycolate oxidase n=1 Tax=Spirilliplanes yamanashiensis TaxID=42233 RepID=A0A8J3YEX8_9ACTN|nr:FAD-binding oxidoreductase [Spirilliplanes yamanashiensis]MDP9815293.1 glycolate oxidase FAD binding subunit [Spirilliplanes yamanashiensis]GIJ06437.1 glycolate oxidase [Spirilliplanes yamanashiensis]
MTTPLPSREPVLRALVEICGPHFARPGGPADTVAGRQARWVAAPGTDAAVADTLQLATARNLAVVPRGSGTKIDWGWAPPGVDLILDTARLAGIWDHRPEAGTAQVGAGTPVRAVQRALALHGQRLALDPPSADASLGGVLATNEAGPLRHRYGPPSAQVSAVSYVLPGGAAVTAPPDDLRPPDGVILAATVRVQTIPDTRIYAGCPVWTPLQVHDLVAQILAADADPSAIEVDLPAPGADQPGTLVVLVEGGPVSARQRAARIADLLGPSATVSGTAPPWWGRYPFGPDDVALRVTVPIADLHAAVYALRDAAGVAVPVRGSAGVGSVHAVLPRGLSPLRVEQILDAARSVLLARGGRCVVVSAPPAIRAAVDVASRDDLF